MNLDPNPSQRVSFLSLCPCHNGGLQALETEGQVRSGPRISTERGADGMIYLNKWKKTSLPESELLRGGRPGRKSQWLHWVKLGQDSSLWDRFHSQKTYYQVKDLDAEEPGTEPLAKPVAQDGSVAHRAHREPVSLLDTSTSNPSCPQTGRHDSAEMCG